MVDQDTQGFNLSAEELRQLTNWPEAVIEDYLNISGSSTRVVNEINVELTEITQEVDAILQDVSGINVNRARVVKLGKRITQLQTEIQAIQDAQAALDAEIANLETGTSNQQAALSRIRIVERNIPAQVATRVLTGI